MDAGPFDIREFCRGFTGLEAAPGCVREWLAIPEQLLCALITFAEQVGNVIAGPVILRHERAADALRPRTPADPCEVLVLQKVLRRIAPEHRFERPGGMCLSAYHAGPFEQMGEAYERIFSYACAHGHATCACAYECFVTDYWTTYDPAMFVVEVLVPIGH